MELDKIFSKPFKHMKYVGYSFIDHVDPNLNLEKLIAEHVVPSKDFYNHGVISIDKEFTLFSVKVDIHEPNNYEDEDYWKKIMDGVYSSTEREFFVGPYIFRFVHAILGKDAILSWFYDRLKFVKQ